MRKLLRLAGLGMAAACATVSDPVSLVTLPQTPCPLNLVSCTANDVVTVPTKVVQFANDICLSPTDTITFDLTLQFDPTANSRYDLGLYISSDGKRMDRADETTAQTCLGYAPQIDDGDKNAFLDDCDTDLFLGLDNTGHKHDPDTCGDLGAKTGPAALTVRTTVSCSTVAPDSSYILVPCCRVWENNPNHDTACKNISQAGTGSKCDCTPLLLKYPTINPCLLKNCDDHNDCTLDQCNVDTDGVPQCSHIPNNGEWCDDHNGCTTNDVCVQSTCTGTPNPPSNTQCINYVCNASTNWVAQPVADNTPCDDGVFCTSGDACHGGQCYGDVPTDCSQLDGTCHSGFCNSQTNQCETRMNDAGTPCGNSGSSICDNPDTCDANGNCLPNYESTNTICGAGVGLCEDDRHCDGLGACQVTGAPLSSSVVCRPSTGGCDRPENCDGSSIDCPAELAPLDCDDGIACTIDKCINGVSCDNGDPLICYDNNACTSNACTEPNGCAFTTISCESDGNVCHTPICDNTTGCGFINNVLPCDDGDYCTEADQCSGGACTPGTPVECQLAEGQDPVCVSYACNPSDGKCVPTFHDDISCVSADPCQIQTTCNAGYCTGGQPKNCDDGHYCTVDSCDAQTGECLNVFNAELSCSNPALPCAPTAACDSQTKECEYVFLQTGASCSDADLRPPTDLSCWNSPTCQLDHSCAYTPKTAGTACGSSELLGDCDALNTCNAFGECVDNVQPSTVVCRQSDGVCDKTEYCDGINYNCPDDRYKCNGWPCRDASTICELPAVCNGESPVCPPNELQGPNVPCTTPVVSVTNCQSAGRCAGTTNACIVPPAKNCNDDNSCTIDNCTLTGDLAVCSNTIPTGVKCCGCTYTKGYFGSSRFLIGKPTVNGTSVANTCNWPVSPFQCTGAGCTHWETKQLNCLISSQYTTYWTVIHTSTAPLKTINQKWWLASQQAISFYLNVLNGACATGCNTQSSTCTLLRSFFNVDVIPFLGLPSSVAFPTATSTSTGAPPPPPPPGPSGQSCTVSDKTAIGTCGSSCQQLCALLSVPAKSCTLAVVAEAFNSGNTTNWPEHCQDPDTTTATRRGCCVNCNCYDPACTGGIILYQNIDVATELSDASDPARTLDEKLDIVTMSFVIAGTVALIAIATIMYMALCNPKSKYHTQLMNKVDYTAVPGGTAAPIRGRRPLVML